MSKDKNKYQVQAGKTYKVTFGVKQSANVNKAANAVNETPEQFIKVATMDNAKALIGD